jgi:hypothetical protein
MCVHHALVRKKKMRYRLLLSLLKRPRKLHWVTKHRPRQTHSSRNSTTTTEHHYYHLCFLEAEPIALRRKLLASCESKAAAMSPRSSRGDISCCFYDFHLSRHTLREHCSAMLLGRFY